MMSGFFSSFVSARDNTRLDDLVEEITRKLQTGAYVDVDGLTRDYPEEAEWLGRLVPALEALAGLRSGLPKDAELADDSPSSVAQPLGDFRIIREIGRGGMGVVYEAEQLSLGRRVALKVLPFAAVMDPRQLARFKTEAQAAAHLQHQNIVPVYGVGCERGVHYYAMQYIEGHTLATVIDELTRMEGPERHEASGSGSPGSKLAGQLISGRFQQSRGGIRSQREGPLPPSADILGTPVGASAAPERDTAASVDTARIAAVTTAGATSKLPYFRAVASLGVQVAEALDHAHQQGVVHRDIKPANLMLDSAGNLWVTDFGLARIETNPGLTMTGDVVGTLRYMAPEQALAKRVVVDHRVDIYSLGATLYELLTLRPAFPGHDRREILNKIAFVEPIAPRRIKPTVPADLETIVGKAMAKAPEKRYETAKELADDLCRFLEHKPIHAKRPSLLSRAQKWAWRHRMVVAASIVLLIVAVVGLAISTLLIARERAEAVRQRKLAEARQLDAENANREARWALYVSDMALALQEFGGGNVGRVVDLLNRHRPASDGQDLPGFEWYYLWQATHGYTKELVHGDPVWSLAVSPDERFAASGSLSGTIKIWDLPSGTLRRSFKAHPDHVRSLAFSPDGSQLASAGGTAGLPGEIKLWDPETGTLDAGFTGHDNTVLTVAYSPDGATLATGSADYTIGVWDLETTSLKRTLKGHDFQVQCLKFTPDGKKLVSGGGDARLLLWDLGTGQSEVIERAGGSKESLAFGPNGALLAFSSGTAVSLYDVATKKITPDVVKHSGQVHSVAFSRDGRALASAGRDNTIIVLDKVGRRVSAVLQGHSHYVTGVAFYNQGRNLVSGSWDGTLKIWDLHAPHLRTWRPKGPRVGFVAFSDVARRVAFDGNVWDLTTDRLILDLSSRNASTGSYAGDGKSVAVVPGESSDVELWDVESESQRALLAGHESLVFAVAFSPDGKLLASGSRDSTVRLWDPWNGSLKATLPCSPDGSTQDLTPLSIAFSPRGSHLAAACNDRAVRVWNLKTHELEKTIRKHAGAVTCLVFSPMGNTFATASRDATVKLWDWGTFEVTATLRGHAGEVLALAYSPDARTLASAGGDGSIKLWDLARQQLRATLIDGTAPIRSLSFSRDGRTLAAAVGGGVRLWHAAAEDEPAAGAYRQPMARRLIEAEDWFPQVGLAPRRLAALVNQ